MPGGSISAKRPNVSQHEGAPAGTSIRSCSLDPARQAILLLGGDKGRQLETLVRQQQYFQSLTSARELAGERARRWMTMARNCGATFADAVAQAA